MAQRVLINVEPEDIRVAILEEGILTDLFIENRHEKTIVGDIYKGVVTDVIPGIQAAFVDIGLDRNAFLHVQDIPPAEGDEPFKERGRRRARDDGQGEGRRMNIADYLKPGQKIMVQAIKDGIGDKGPRISQYISLPGRYLVLLPGQTDDDAGGVSRKIEDSRERSRLKKILETLNVTEGSVILRTAAVDTDEQAIAADVEFLRRTWARIQAKMHTAKAPALLHTDFDILYRLVRDVFTEEIDEICIDDTAEHANLVRMLRQYLPKLKNRVLLYPSTRNLFEVYDIERQIYKALRRRVWLRSGGHVVIDECEALTAIDVNTGKFIGKEDQDATVLRTNLEAARVIARQLRLRDIGGIIIIDFIDMRRREHREEVLRELKRCLRLDRARTTVSDFTSLGIVEMTRKRVRHSLRKTLQRDCPYCGGNGMILSPDSIWRVVRNAVLSLIEDHPDHDIRILVHPEILAHIESRHLPTLRELEDEHGITITLGEGDASHQERYTLEATPRGGEAAPTGKVVVVGKRFSGAELEEAAQTRPPRRRRPPRREEIEEEVEESPEAEETAEQSEATPAATPPQPVALGAPAPALDSQPAQAPDSHPAEAEGGDVAASAAAKRAQLLRMLEGESLSGRLVQGQPEEEPEPPQRERHPRRRSRGGRGRRRQRRPEAQAADAGAGEPAEGGAKHPEESPTETGAEQGPVAVAGPSTFTPVEQYLGDDDPAAATAEAKPAKRPARRGGGTRRRSPARRRAAKAESEAGDAPTDTGEDSGEA